MQHFTNKTIDISSLPKFEEVFLKRLDVKYFKIILINISIFFGILFLALISVSYVNEDFFSNTVWLLIGICFPVLLTITIILYYYSYKKRGYALRQHDVIFKSGVISETTVIVTNNRVQHVALHQGLFSRMFGLASIELFTAGGSSSDLKIDGILIEEAKKIKESVSKKIIEITEEQKEFIEEELGKTENQLHETSNLNNETDAFN
ncbi:conserved hypothetical protein [Flavobacterium sp. 9AF]|uniref:PH domain-containing protein n=1 Tax=Flavobacterium sp. 9AF TaxID=2653142 RepID=UPI0012EF2A0D|nr:PH domain-containing protein [Flavobacterium sp. 9AF]VXB75663.1 conserved hypothetical protein [Flavobacterium sp. 9AF]